ncbi:type II secretion system F family protein [Arthrobacter sp. ISL-69]|uniref:type II secretion system F family protein n=1 Tax=Arthrobacter sp. ISL-69 TaxID=2819113 RepID=UPI001BE51F08|nr:type II secretion system F family protein [Arthrobacter sp. ISL-69]MBT2537116.1 type II secretion system F family protein [Arthrobacter sp. ISL-69]
MGTTAFLILAIALCFGALLLLFFVVLKPRFGAIPVDRRRPDANPEESSFSRVSQSVVDGMGGVLGKSGGPYNRDLLYNAGVKMAPADFTVMVTVAAFLAGLFGTLLTNPVIGTLLGVATPFMARLVLAIRTDKRRGKFEAQLIDTIMMLIGGLRAGHSVMRSIEAAGLESETPTSDELRRVVNETRIGKDARQALEEVADRMDSEDFRWIGQAIQINREVGGDLAEVLEQVAGTIRERSQIKGQVRSLSAEGKMSAMVLMAMPVAVAIMLTVINPGYMNVFVEGPVGITMMVVSLVMFIIGGFWMNRTVKIKF